MSFEKMEALEARVRRLVDLIQELKHSNATLEQDLELTKEQLVKQGELFEGWEQERVQVRDRIEKVLGELEFLDHSNGDSSRDLNV
ncbi:MAG: cell division protein ZapB [Nitrospirae bacterium]|nr:cell division protein ZapB [Nitrospirota bacterium]